MDERSPRPSKGAVEAPVRLRSLRTVVRLLDDWLRVPGTDIRFGLDPLIGLVPGLGELLATGLSGYVVVEAARLGAPWPIIVRMLGNLAVDALVGSVPVLGDVFDVSWKANRRNLELLEQHLTAPHQARRSSLAALAIAVGGVSAMLAGIVGVVVVVARIVFGL